MQRCIPCEDAADATSAAKASMRIATAAAHTPVLPVILGWNVEIKVAGNVTNPSYVWLCWRDKRECKHSTMLSNVNERSFLEVQHWGGNVPCSHMMNLHLFTLLLLSQIATMNCDLVCLWWCDSIAAVYGGNLYFQLQSRQRARCTTSGKWTVTCTNLILKVFSLDEAFHVKGLTYIMLQEKLREMQAYISYIWYPKRSGCHGWFQLEVLRNVPDKTSRGFGKPYRYSRMQPK